MFKTRLNKISQTQTRSSFFNYFICKSIDIDLQNEVYTITTKSSMKTHQTSFELNKPFDEVTLYDTKVKSIVTLENGKMIHKQTDRNYTVIYLY
jgi:hypothetical protein